MAIRRLGSLLLLIVALTTAGCRGRKAVQESPDPYAGAVDASALQTYSGSVLSLVDTATPQRPCCIQMVLVTEDGNVTVDLGPAALLNRHTMTLRPDDRVTVTGVMIQVKGKPVVIASQITKGNQTLQVRVPSALPSWGQSQ